MAKKVAFVIGNTLVYSALVVGTAELACTAISRANDLIHGYDRPIIHKIMHRRKWA